MHPQALQLGRPFVFADVVDIQLVPLTAAERAALEVNRDAEVDALLAEVNPDSGGFRPFTASERARDWMGNPLPNPEAEFERLVAEGMQRERVRDEVRRRLQTDTAGELALPRSVMLADFLDETSEPMQYRVEGLANVGGNVLFTAQAKAGKTTLRDNLIRSLADGDRFLGRFLVRPVASRIALLDLELPEDNLRDWLRLQGIRSNAVQVTSLKGRERTFDIRNDRVRARWAEQLAGADVLMLDAAAPLFAALGLKENTEAGDLLPYFDALKAEAGIADGYFVHHQGHVAERARGDSRLIGWADALWSYVVGKDGVTRYLSVTGRDVALAETALDFDHGTKRLTIAGGNRHEAAVIDALGEVLAVIDAAGGGVSGAAIERAIDDELAPRAAVRAALSKGVQLGKLRMSTGARGAHVYQRGTR